MVQVSVTVLLLLFVVFGMRDPGAQGCTCLASHFQTRFCSFDVVLRVEVLKEETIPEEKFFWKKYKIKVNQVFKGSEKLKDIQFIHTRTAASSCFIELPEKIQYLVSGKVLNNETLQIQSCDFHEPWYDLTVNQRIHLESNYPKSCECKVTECSGGFIPGPLDCIWTESHEDEKTGLQQVCLKVSEENCRWFGYASIPTPMCAKK